MEIMAEKYETLFNSVESLCAGYVEATHLLPHMPFIRSKAGSICKAHKRSIEEGFRVMYDALIKSDEKEKWKKYVEALNEAEFNSVYKLCKFMDRQTENFDSYCKIFSILSREITEGQLNVITFADALKSTQAITDSQLKNIELIEESEGTNSAAILLLAYFPSSLTSLMNDLETCLHSMEKNDLLQDIKTTVILYEEEEEEENFSPNRKDMIKLCYDVIIDSVHPRDIWNKVATDLDLALNNIGFHDNRKDMEKMIKLFDESAYKGKFQSLYAALSEAGYEQICMKINDEKCHEEENNSYKRLLETHHEFLGNKIKATEILDALYKSKVINSRDKEEITTLSTTRGDKTATECLLERIPLKKDMWFKDFFKILIKNSQVNLVEHIDPDFDQKSVAKDDIDFNTNFDVDYEEDNKREVKTSKEEIKLRDYQKELIEKGLLGKNCIIAAPTGSGKTVMATKIIEHHLEKNRSRSCKVVFLCNQTGLADQQGGVLMRYFPFLKINIIYGFSENQTKKIELFNSSDIVVMTPQCLVDDLKFDRIKNFSIITLLIIDECHHTYSKHPYNVLMSRYLEEKINKTCQLPQVIGLTAAAGIDVAKINKGAKEHILEICSNLDCDELCIVKKHVADLESFIHQPEENITALNAEKETAFGKLIRTFMKEVHDDLDTEFVGNSLNFGTTQYVGWLSETMKRVKCSPSEHKYEFASLRLLEKCNSALQLIKDYCVMVALKMLYGYLESETLNTDAFQKLKTSLEYKLDKFKKHSSSQEMEAESSCLSELVEKIQKQFHEKPDSRVIVFVETKENTRILQSVLADKIETADFNPQYLAGNTSETSSGMSINRQKEILALFRSGECKLMVSTPVAEEGLDIQKCNLVIDYLTVKGVRSHVQKRGRTRAAESEYLQITGADQLLIKRAQRNRVKVNNMKIALDEVYEEQSKDPILFKKTLEKMQMENWQLRLTSQNKKVKPLNASRSYTLKCTSCNTFAAESSDFRVIEEKCYIIANLNFRNKIIVTRSRQIDLFDDIKRIGKFCCRECKLYWGIQVVYKNTIFDCIKIEQFKIFCEGSDPIVVKKWLKVPFKSALKPISEDDFQMYRGNDVRNFEDDDNDDDDNDNDDNDDDNDVQNYTEKFPIPESTPFEN